jgi:hypothetical protein
MHLYLKIPSLKIRRIRSIAIETFKIINKETPQYLHDLVTLKNNKYNFRYSNTFKYFSHSF